MGPPPPRYYGAHDRKDPRRKIKDPKQATEEKHWGASDSSAFPRAAYDLKEEWELIMDIIAALDRGPCEVSSLSSKYAATFNEKIRKHRDTPFDKYGKNDGSFKDWLEQCGFMVGKPFDRNKRLLYLPASPKGGSGGKATCYWREKEQCVSSVPNDQPTCGSKRVEEAQRPTIGDTVRLLDTEVTQNWLKEGIGKQFVIASDAQDSQPYEVEGHLNIYLKETDVEFVGNQACPCGRVFRITDNYCGVCGSRKPGAEEAAGETTNGSEDTDHVWLPQREPEVADDWPPKVEHGSVDSTASTEDGFSGKHDESEAEEEEAWTITDAPRDDEWVFA